MKKIVNGVLADMTADETTEWEQRQVIDPAVVLAAERAQMSCTPMQGILALGESNWGLVVSYRDTQATWAQRVIINSAQTWVRNSQNIAFFQFLLSFTDAQVDDLFRTAMLIDA
jgi:hypothetical protein